jgi:uncharacterized protein (AIM24 family)
VKADTVGSITPAVLVRLAPGEKALAPHGLMLYKEPSIQLHRRTLRSLGVGLGELMALQSQGGSEEEYFLAEFEGPGALTLSRDKGGEARVISIPAGQSLQFGQGHLIAFDSTIRYRPMLLARFLVATSGAQAQYGTLIGDQLTGPGQAVVQGHGNLLQFTLGPGEQMRSSIPSFLGCADTVGLEVRSYWLPNPTGFATRPMTQIHYTGPGQVLLQSGV